MKRSWIFLLPLLVIVGFILVKCGQATFERQEAQAMYNANDAAAKACMAKLNGLKRVPIVGWDGKRFLDADRLPSWDVGLDYSHYKPGMECGAGGMQEAEIFYWAGKEVILQSAWLAQGHKLTERPGPQDWASVQLDLIGFGNGKKLEIIFCKEHPDTCAETEARTKRPQPQGMRWISLKHYPIDVHIPADWETNPKVGPGLSLRDWHKENGQQMPLTCSMDYQIFSGKTDEEVADIIFDDKDPFVCQIEPWDFRFRWGSARPVFNSREFSSITPILRAIETYINNSVIDKE